MDANPGYEYFIPKVFNLFLLSSSCTRSFYISIFNYSFVFFYHHYYIYFILLNYKYLLPIYKLSLTSHLFK